MTWEQFVPSQRTLAKAVHKFFRDHYEPPVINILAEIDPNLRFVPAISFQSSDFVTICAEFSEATAYPPVLALKYAELLQVVIPISIYAAIPEEIFLRNDMQTDVIKLEEHGFGLLTVNANGNVTKRFEGIPLAQVISKQLFESEIAAYPRSARSKLRHSYDLYIRNPMSGLQDLTVLAEGLVNAAISKAIKLGIFSSKLQKQTLATKLKAMSLDARFRAATAAIGGMQSLVKYRNSAHHHAKSKSAMLRRLTSCRHYFLDGIKEIKAFCDAMARAGITVKL